MPPLIGNRDQLRAAVASKRTQIAALEAAWVTASEAAAARAGSRAVRMDDRATWDRATWARYLAAAESNEADYKPRIKRLLTEIDNIERLLAMPEQCVAGAA